MEGEVDPRGTYQRRQTTPPQSGPPLLGKEESAKLQECSYSTNRPLNQKLPSSLRRGGPERSDWWGGEAQIVTPKKLRLLPTTPTHRPFTLPLPLSPPPRIRSALRYNLPVKMARTCSSISEEPFGRDGTSIEAWPSLMSAHRRTSCHSLPAEIATAELRGRRQSPAGGRKWHHRDPETTGNGGSGLKPLAPCTLDHPKNAENLQPNPWIILENSLLRSV